MVSEDIRNRIAKCCQNFNISMQLPALIEKMEALYLPRKTTERAAENPEAENRPTPPAMTPHEMAVLYEELEANLKRFLKALGKREVEVVCSSQAPPPAAEDE